MDKKGLILGVFLQLVRLTVFQSSLLTEICNVLYNSLRTIFVWQEAVILSFKSHFFLA